MWRPSHLSGGHSRCFMGTRPGGAAGDRGAGPDRQVLGDVGNTHSLGTQQSWGSPAGSVGSKEPADRPTWLMCRLVLKVQRRKAPGMQSCGGKTAGSTPGVSPPGRTRRQTLATCSIWGTRVHDSIHWRSWSGRMHRDRTWGWERATGSSR